MRSKVFLIIFAGLVSCMGAYAQQIAYTYDASGNCISRTYQNRGPSSLKSSTADENDLNTKQNDFDTILLTEENSIKVYPNPNNGMFSVELTGYGDDLKNGTMTIFSAQGRVVLKLNSLQPINSINLNNQTNGTYVLQIRINEKSFSHKVIVNK